MHDQHHALSRPIYLESLIPLNCISHLNKHVGNVCLFDVYATYISKRACFYPKFLGRLKAGYLRLSLCTVYVTCMLSTQGCWYIVEKAKENNEICVATL